MGQIDQLKTHSYSIEAYAEKQQKKAYKVAQKCKYERDSLMSKLEIALKGLAIR